jgi:hypothetical protein
MIIKKLSKPWSMRRTFGKINPTPMANEDPIPVDGQENEANLADDGWMMLSPYGDFPHRLGLQRVDRTAADSMVAAFNGFWGRLRRWTGGYPIYAGHPDMARQANEVDRYPDKTAHGMITQLEARADGLYGKAAFFPSGAALMENKTYRFVSPYWGSVDAGQEKGKPVKRPVQLYSVGLTNRPNLPVPMVNDKGDTDIPVCSSQSANDTTKEHTMQILATLAALLGMANDAGEPLIIAKVTELKTQVADANTRLAAAEAAQTAMANERDGEIATLKTQLSNAQNRLVAERSERSKLLVSGALQAGRITIAEQPQWLTALANEAEFDTKAAELAALKPKIPTTSQTGDLAARTVKMANESERRGTVQELVKTKMSLGLNYDAAWAAVKRENPALFAAMEKQ